MFVDWAADLAEDLEDDTGTPMHVRCESFMYVALRRVFERESALVRELVERIVVDWGEVAEGSEPPRSGSQIPLTTGAAAGAPVTYMQTEPPDARLPLPPASAEAKRLAGPPMSAAEARDYVLSQVLQAPTRTSFIRDLARPGAFLACVASGRCPHAHWKRLRDEPRAAGPTRDGTEIDGQRAKVAKLQKPGGQKK